MGEASMASSRSGWRETPRGDERLPQRDAMGQVHAQHRDGRKWAIEVKVGKTSREELGGLFRFVRDHPDFEPHLLSWEGQKINGIRSLDAEKTLAMRGGA